MPGPAVQGRPSIIEVRPHLIHFTLTEQIGAAPPTLACRRVYVMGGDQSTFAPDGVTCEDCLRAMSPGGGAYAIARDAKGLSTGPLAAARIAAKCDEIKGMLLEKNAAYNNSAFHPQRIFSKLGPEDRIRVRLDDKLARIVAGNEDLNEDAILDTVGYLVLLLIQKESGEK